MRASSHIVETGHQGPKELSGPILGCGNPLDRANLKPGEDVLDLGSGAGREVIESAFRIAPDGIAYGLDMTDEMLALASENRRRAGAFNSVFLKGTIENIPLPDASVDVIISNCVINLSQDKPAVMREMMRVLRPGGRLAISDTVADRPVSDRARSDMDLWCACISGAPQPDEYRSLLVEAGFENVGIDVAGWDDGDKEGRGFRVGSAYISGVRPAAKQGLSRPMPATREDLPDILRLLESAGLPTVGLKDGNCSLVVQKDGEGQIAGVGGVEFYGTQALFRSLCVRPDLQGKGIGTRLTAALIRMARAQGCKEAYLLTTTAERYAERRGFRAIERSEVTGPVTQATEFQSACPKTAMVMRMSLAACCC
jgi:N-acetylglutamate synthase-like GNAT family acetyltransferase